MPSLGVITRDTVEGPRPHRLTPSFVTLPLAAFSPFRGSSGSAPRSSVGPSEAPCVCVRPPAELWSLNKPHRAGLGRASP